MGSRNKVINLTIMSNNFTPSLGLFLILWRLFIQPTDLISAARPSEELRERYSKMTGKKGQLKSDTVIKIFTLQEQWFQRTKVLDSSVIRNEVPSFEKQIKDSDKPKPVESVPIKFISTPGKAKVKLPKTSDYESGPVIFQMSHGFSLFRESRQLMNTFENQGYKDISEVRGFEPEADSHKATSPLYIGAPISISILVRITKMLFLGVKAGRASLDYLDVAQDTQNAINYYYSNKYAGPYLQLSIAAASKTIAFARLGPIINVQRNGTQWWYSGNYSRFSNRSVSFGFMVGGSAVLKSAAWFTWALDFDYLYGGKLSHDLFPGQSVKQSIRVNSIALGNSVYFNFPSGKKNKNQRKLICL